MVNCVSEYEPHFFINNIANHIQIKTPSRQPEWDPRNEIVNLWYVYNIKNVVNQEPESWGDTFNVESLTGSEIDSLMDFPGAYYDIDAMLIKIPDYKFDPIVLHLFTLVYSF